MMNSMFAIEYDILREEYREGFSPSSTNQGAPFFTEQLNPDCSPNKEGQK
jgi:hypothetical protein